MCYISKHFPPHGESFIFMLGSMSLTSLIMQASQYCGFAMEIIMSLSVVLLVNQLAHPNSSWLKA